MTIRLPLPWQLPAVGLIVWAVALPATAQQPAAAAPKKIYVVTDLEGISGVYKFTQTRETDTPLALQAREYFMGDLAAVVRGLRDGGATEILVLDGHGNQAVIPHLMEPGAKYLTGLPRPPGLHGLDETYAGLVFVGYHAMMGTPDGVLHHTQSSKSENRYWYNGVESGELAQCAAIAAHFGVPPILVTGDEAVCREAKQFFGDACVTVAVKQGVARESAILYPFAGDAQGALRGRQAGHGRHCQLQALQDRDADPGQETVAGVRRSPRSREIQTDDQGRRDS